MWCIEFDPKTRALTIRLAHLVSAASLRILQRKHVEALAATAAEPFKVLLDLRGVAPLGPDSAAVLSEVKRAEALLQGFRGRAVLCDSATVAMQQRRTSLNDGTAEREVVTLEPLEAHAYVRLP